MKDIETTTFDPRFKRIDNLDETLKQCFVEGRIDLKAANTLCGMTVGEQRRIARWLHNNPDRKIGAQYAKALLKERLERGSLDYKQITRLLTKRRSPRTHSYITVPLSDLPKGLSKEAAQVWLHKAIQAYIKQEH